MGDIKVVTGKKKLPTDHKKKEAPADKVVANILDKELSKADPKILATPLIELTADNPLKAVNLLFPPGVSKFYVERVDKNHIRFLINTDEITRLAEKADKLMEGSRGAIN